MEHMGITDVHRFHMVSADSSLRLRPLPQDPHGLVRPVKRNVCDRPGWLSSDSSKKRPVKRLVVSFNNAYPLVN